MKSNHKSNINEGLFRLFYYSLIKQKFIFSKFNENEIKYYQNKKQKYKDLHFLWFIYFLLKTFILK